MSVRIVAEMSANHRGSLDAAMDLVHAAKRAGADAIKLQTYTPDTITIRSDAEWFLVDDGPWEGQTLWDLYAEAHTPWEWHRELFDAARRLGMQAFSTPFDKSAVDFLEQLDCPLYKVSSFDVVNIPLLKRIRATGKPVIMSTGMASEHEIGRALAALRDRPVTLLHCVSEYPAPLERMNLGQVSALRRRWNRDTGLSDHSMGHMAALASVAQGAVMIEKHLCLKRQDGGPDAGFSLEPHEFTTMVHAVRDLERAMQAPQERESSHRWMRPSLWWASDLRTGDVVKPSDIRVARPGHGLPPIELPFCLNRFMTADVMAGTPVRLEQMQ